jgi:hypothetical protein
VVRLNFAETSRHTVTVIGKRQQRQIEVEMPACASHSSQNYTRAAGIALGIPKLEEIVLF